MNKENLTLQEKFKALTFLQSKIPFLGNYSLSFLKTKNLYQISFVNGYKEKFLHSDLDVCIDATLEDLDKLHFMEFKTDWFEEMNRENENVMLKAKIADLEKKLKEFADLGHESLLPYLTKSDEDTELLEEDKVVFDEGDETTTMRDNVPKIIKNIQQSIRNVEKKKKVRKKTKHSEISIQKEMLKKLKGMDLPSTKGNNKRGRPKSNKVKTIKDLTIVKNNFSVLYDKEYKKAYSRITNRSSIKNKQKVKNLTIKDNKYGITKDWVIADMQRKLGEKYDKLNSTEYLSEWKSAKARVWNKEYNSQKSKSIW